MQLEKHISQLDLSRSLGQVFQAVGKGETVIVEEEGQPRAAIVEFVDLQILRAVIGYYIHRPRLDPDAGFPDAKLTGLSGQPLFDRVICHYLARTISLSRAAEALAIPWVELRSRLTRLGVPVWTAPADAAGARRDAAVAESIVP